jgi:hypothetical protein
MVHPGIYLKGLEKTTKISVMRADLRAESLNPVSPKYETGVLTTNP